MTDFTALNNLGALLTAAAIALGLYAAHIRRNQ